MNCNRCKKEIVASSEGSSIKLDINMLKVKLCGSCRAKRQHYLNEAVADVEEKIKHVNISTTERITDYPRPYEEDHMKEEYKGLSPRSYVYKKKDEDYE